MMSQKMPRIRSANRTGTREAAVAELASLSRSDRAHELQRFGYSQATANAAADVLELMVNAFVTKRPAFPLSGKAEDDDRIE